MKILFLDIDGVLNWNGCAAREPSGMMGISDAAVSVLARIIRATGCKIVLTSTWRLDWDKNPELLSPTGKYLVKKLRRSRLHIFDKVSDSFPGRGHAIRNWLNDHKKLGIASWCVLDDEIFEDYDFFGITDHLVKTSWDTGGIQPEHVTECVRLLSTETL